MNKFPKGKWKDQSILWISRLFVIDILYHKFENIETKKREKEGGEKEEEEKE